MHADGAAGGRLPHAFRDATRIDRAVAFGLDGVRTNRAESRFPASAGRSRAGTTASPGDRPAACARETARREDARRCPDGGTLRTRAAGAALGHPVSRVWKECRQGAAAGRAARAAAAGVHATTLEPAGP